MSKIYIYLLSLCSVPVHAQHVQWDSLARKIMPNSIKIQYAGNIGMFATGIGYQSPNKRWAGDLLYGIVPPSYADDAIHSVTMKGKYSALSPRYYEKQKIEMHWLQVGLWFNYSFGDQYFLGLPSYYDAGYYYFPTALNLGLTLGSEVRYKKWGLYYELGTTEKRAINYVKNLQSINFNEIWNIGLGVVYHLK